MTFRRKLLTVFALTVSLSVAAVALLVLGVTRNTFEKTEEQRTTALVTQFQREFSRRGDEVARRVEAVATSNPVSRMATVVNGTPADSAEYFELARQMAEGYQLDFLEFLDGHGTIISSAQWPAKFGYPDAGSENLTAASGESAFLKREELQDSTALGLFAVRVTRVGEHPIYVVGGRRLDKNFLSALDLPPDMRVLLYQNRSEHFSGDSLLDPGVAGNGTDTKRPADKFAPLVEAVRQYTQETTAIVERSADQAGDEVFHAIPLRGGVGQDRPLMGILLVGNSRRSYVD